MVAGNVFDNVCEKMEKIYPENNICPRQQESGSFCGIVVLKEQQALLLIISY